MNVRAAIYHHALNAIGSEGRTRRELFEELDELFPDAGDKIIASQLDDAARDAGVYDYPWWHYHTK